jgi:uncharacterized protein YaiI (UPF0178 family)
MPMLNIYVDADACPVKEEVIKVADRHKLDVYMVSNSYLRPINKSNIHLVLVESGADIADNWIVERIKNGDIAVTADILLAQRCLANKAEALNPNGKIFTNENIGNAVAGRILNAHLREIGEITGGNPSFTKQNRSAFLQRLENTIQAIKRR